MKIENNAILMEKDEYDHYVTTGQLSLAGEDLSIPDGELTTNENIAVTLYELNKQILAQKPVFTDEDYDNAEGIIEDWVFDSHRASYYMLLCKELSYYTIFHAVDGLIVDEFIRELYEVLDYIGPIHDIHIDNNDAIAIWAEWEDTKELHCFYLFPYDRGVVEF